ncbi:MAG: DUF721 domain-containing protein [Pirellula sp.]|nr:DUF721 domain-containing protein [Pirellula sp.]
MPSRGGDGKLTIMNDEEYYLSQIPKPLPTRLGASKVSSLLQRVIQQKGYAAVQSANELLDVWNEAVGKDLIGQTRVGKVSRGALQVFVPNQVIRTEVEFRKGTILRVLQSRLPEYQIQRLTIRVDR